MQAPGHRDCGHHLRQDPHPAHELVRRHWYVTNQKNGVSALGLKQVLGLGSYQTAWTMLHKLRRAMVCLGRDRLSGVVEVDETYACGSEPGMQGRQTEKKAIVVMAARGL